MKTIGGGLARNQKPWWTSLFMAILVCCLSLRQTRAGFMQNNGQAGSKTSPFMERFGPHRSLQSPFDTRYIGLPNFFKQVECAAGHLARLSATCRSFVLEYGQDCLDGIAGVGLQAGPLCVPVCRFKGGDYLISETPLAPGEVFGLICIGGQTDVEIVESTEVAVEASQADEDLASDDTVKEPVTVA
eukprot:GHVS01047306.1.p1 GENE.GHVS01047306.1~~GHVS01047306.1.p1  ORF type:complete len:187 (+),score=8.68 GHVS01047306.1:63-623(+)